MKMKVKQVYPGTKTCQAVKKLYFEAFPENERLSFSRMVLLSLIKPSASLLSFWDGEELCGFTFTVETKQFLYINYIAVNPNLRSRGYGTKLLDALHERWPMAQLCDARVPQEGTEDYDQDLRRIAFWERNGFDFYGNAHTITNPQGVTYYICGKGVEFDREAYFGVFDHLSFGPGAMVRVLRNKA